MCSRESRILVDCSCLIGVTQALQHWKVIVHRVLVHVEDIYHLCYVAVDVEDKGTLFFLISSLYNLLIVIAMAPTVFSSESQMLIHLWGLAYIGTGQFCLHV